MDDTLSNQKAWILSRVSLRALSEEAGAIFHGRASRCPLHHGDNPGAFRLYDDDRRWHCFTHCPPGRNGGDLFAFYMAWKKVNFQAAWRALSALAGSAPGMAPPAPGLQLPPLSGAAALAGEALCGKAELAKTPSGASPLEGSAPGGQTGSEEPPGPAWRQRAAAFVEYARAQLLHPREGARARAYLFSERGLRPGTWETFCLGYNPVDLYDEPARWGQDGTSRVWLPRGLVIPGFFEGQLWYVKVRRPLPAPDDLAEYLPPVTRRRQEKFHSIRGWRSTLFGADLWLGMPLLLLVEGEWDAMLTWQQASDLCDVVTLGSASNRLHALSLAALACYPRLLAVYDDDPAGDQARRRLAGLPRVALLQPPAHDLSDYWKTGRDLRLWVAEQVTAYLPELLNRLDPERHSAALLEWQRLYQAAQSLTAF